MAMTETPTSPTQPTAISRRRVLALLGAGGAGAVLIARQAAASTTSTTTAGTTAATTAGSAVTAATAASPTVPASPVVTPTETGGPFPADGTNDNGEGTVANVLSDARSVRSDIRGDLDGNNVQEGVPMSLQMLVVDSTGAVQPGAAVYIWHCNREGQYSQYNAAMLGGDFSDFSWLRGVQIADDKGLVTFQTILPGRYQGRAFHIHFEVYADGTYATKRLTSQMGMDDDLIDSLYTKAAGYEKALATDTNNAQDNIFSDGYDHQLLSVSGDVTTALATTFTAVVS